jgi:hypothetical protein
MAQLMVVAVAVELLLPLILKELVVLVVVVMVPLGQAVTTHLFKAVLQGLLTQAVVVAICTQVVQVLLLSVMLAHKKVLAVL